MADDIRATIAAIFREATFDAPALGEGTSSERAKVRRDISERSAAKVAEALADPTAEMILAGADAIGDLPLTVPCAELAEAAWRAMVAKL